ncbi:MAG: hypothetical protein U9Q35_03090 [Pseudomonadota bacterium]|nr:hypothetical protein [Pseudomonadota bacterium]
MAAIDYLHNHGLQVEPLPGDQLSVWPADLITPEVRLWIRDHKHDLLSELVPANDDRRMTWRVVRNGQGITMLGRPMSYEQALESAKARWPNDSIIVEEYRE